LAEVRQGGLAGAAVLVVGAGEMGSLAATAAAASGARVVVASPTAGHAAAVADAVGGTAAPFDPGPAALAVDGVIVALSGRWRGSRETREAIARVPLVVDLSMPRALPQDVITRLGSRYVDLDAIAEPRDAASPAGDRASERYRERLEALRDRTVEACLERLSGRASGDLAVTLARRVEAERRAELDVLWRRLPHVPPDERHAIEAMTRHLAGRLFRAPLSRLASERDGQRRRLARELFEL
jgi:glutamyl-tRNA reductase